MSISFKSLVSGRRLCRIYFVFDGMIIAIDGHRFMESFAMSVIKYNYLSNGLNGWE